MGGLLRELAPDLWVGESPLSYVGLEVGRLMSVVRLRSGKLFVHSPAPLTGALRAELDGLGVVAFVVPASRLHGHVSMGEYQRAYPRARLYCTAGLERHRRDLHFAAPLGSVPEPGWQGDVEQTTFDGAWRLDEVEFFHSASRTLIAGDLCMNVGQDWPLLTRLWINGPRLRGGLHPPVLLRAASLRNRRAACASVERILAWDFDRVIPGHGEIVPTGAKEHLRAGFDWLLR